MPEPVHVTFIHGLANKPAPKDLRRIWLDALRGRVGEDSGFDLGAVGVGDAFSYWADLFYDEPIAGSDFESRGDELDAAAPGEPDLADDAWTRAMLEKFPDAEDQAFDDPPDEPADEDYEAFPVPKALKKRLMRHFVREAHAYLFNVDGIRDTIRARVLDDLRSAPDGTRRVLVGHSQGTFIAYDVLTGVDDCPEIAGFLTLGSPLGVDEVQAELEWSRDDGFPRRLQGDWVNVYDPYDVVSRLDPKLAGDFRQAGVEKVIDVREENWGKWRHSATKYFKGPQLRSHLRRLCNREED